MADSGPNDGWTRPNVRGGLELHSRLFLPGRLVHHGLGWLQDLSRGVTVHTDGAADRLVRRLGAHAVTLGSHVYLGEGRFEPATPRGLALLSHELAHVRQNREAGGILPGGENAHGEEVREREAMAVERSVLALFHGGRRTTAATTTSPTPRLASSAPAPLHLAHLPVPPAREAGDREAHPQAAPAPALPLRAAEGRPAEPAVASEASSVDPAELASQVYRLLERRFRIDRERLGIGRA